jgi:hypothetical protein
MVYNILTFLLIKLDKGRLERGADNLTAICEPIVLKMWEPRLLTPLWALTACYRDSFTFHLYIFRQFLS